VIARERWRENAIREIRERGSRPGREGRPEREKRGFVMTRFARVSLVAAVSIAIGAGAISLGTATGAVASPASGKTVTLACKDGWRASAGGTYGGVPFSVACNFDRGTTVIEGAVGTSYSIRAGAESLSGAVDCFFTGDDASVQERCGETRLTIR